MSEAVDKLGNIVKFCYGFMTLALLFFFSLLFFFIDALFLKKKYFYIVIVPIFLFPKKCLDHSLSWWTRIGFHVHHTWAVHGNFGWSELGNLKSDSKKCTHMISRLGWIKKTLDFGSCVIILDVTLSIFWLKIIESMGIPFEEKYLYLP